tara:strand:+ start:787 stop:1320 length:534 start_codon:yes stop_codon:yes gene_type:complete
MNIFYLDSDPKIAAQMMCDKHVVKMILESAQMLSTSHRVLDGDEFANENGLYKMAHKNHPSSIWVRSSGLNYIWLWQHMRELMYEYTHRYGKHHATERLKSPLYKCPSNIKYGDFTPPPQCMPDYCKGDDTVKAYQTYYIVEKSGFARWTKRAIPAWFLGETGAKGESRQLHNTENA